MKVLAMYIIFTIIQTALFVVSYKVGKVRQRTQLEASKIKQENIDSTASAMDEARAEGVKAGREEALKDKANTTTQETVVEDAASQQAEPATA